MNLLLTDRQQQAIENGEPVFVTVRGRECVLVPKDACGSSGDEWDDADLRRLLASSFEANGSGTSRAWTPTTTTTGCACERRGV